MRGLFALGRVFKWTFCDTNDPQMTGEIAAIPADWAKKYPVEQVWHLEKSA